MGIFNAQGFYTADFVKSTGKPRYYNTASVPKDYVSKTKCARLNRPVTRDESIVAFRKVQSGYCGLYLRK